MSPWTVVALVQGQAQHVESSGPGGKRAIGNWLLQVLPSVSYPGETNDSERRGEDKTTALIAHCIISCIRSD